jgi:hypothetical protein
VTINISVVDKKPFGIEGPTVNPLQLYRLKDSKKEDELYFLGRINIANAPVICYFHGYSSASGTLHLQDLHPSLHGKFNLIMPQDRSGYRRQGSAFIGGKIWQGNYITMLKDFFTKLKTLIGFNRLLLGGASMGGFGALLYSILLEADECYLSCPQTSLDPESWYYNINDNFDHLEDLSQTKPWCHGYLRSLGIIAKDTYERIRRSHPFVDLPHFIRLLYANRNQNLLLSSSEIDHREVRAVFPRCYYHLTSCRYDHPKDLKSSYQTEFILPLVSAMVECGIHFSQLTLPFPGHDHFHSPSVIARYSENYQEFTRIQISQHSSHDAISRYSAAYLYKWKYFLNAMSLSL